MLQLFLAVVAESNSNLHKVSNFQGMYDHYQRRKLGQSQTNKSYNAELFPGFKCGYMRCYTSQIIGKDGKVKSGPIDLPQDHGMSRKHQNRAICYAFQHVPTGFHMSKPTKKTNPQTAILVLCAPCLELQWYGAQGEIT